MPLLTVRPATPLDRSWLKVSLSSILVAASAPLSGNAGFVATVSLVRGVRAMLASVLGAAAGPRRKSGQGWRGKQRDWRVWSPPQRSSPGAPMSLRS